MKEAVKITEDEGSDTKINPDAIQEAVKKIKNRASTKKLKSDGRSHKDYKDATPVGS